MYRGVVLLLALVVGGAAHAAQPSRPGWAVANGDLPSRRATDLTVITAASARRLRVLWRFRLPRRATAFGAVTANPVIAGDVVYVQDSGSSVYALDAHTGRFDAATGRRLWAKRLGSAPFGRATVARDAGLSRGCTHRWVSIYSDSSI